MTQRLSILYLALGLTLAAQQKPVIGVAGISHESNSFNVNNASPEDFGGVTPQPTAAEFEALHGNASSTVSGYIAGAKQFGLELYPTLVTGAQSG